MADYVSASDIKDAGVLQITGSDYDARLAKIVTRASRIVDRHCRRENDAFAASASATRYFYGNAKAEQWIDEAVSVSEVEISDDNGNSYTALVATDYDKLDGLDYDKTPIRLLRMNPNGNYAKFPGGRKAIKVTGVWGYSDTAPEEVAEAALIIATRLFKRGQAGFGDVVGAPELGEVRYAKAYAPEAFKILDDGGYVKISVG